MKNVFICIACFLVMSALVSAQQPLTLTVEECYKKAENNYPLIKQYDLITCSREYTLENLSKSWFPQISLNGQATYQTEVTEIPIDFSTVQIPVEMDEMSKEQYKATIDISQMVWDGGATKAQKQLTVLESEVEMLQNTVTIYSIRESINQLYFGLLGINDQLILLELNKENIKTNRTVVQSMFNNGNAVQSDIDLLDVELLDIEQKQVEQTTLKQAYLKMLSLFIKEKLDEHSRLIKPTLQSNIFSIPIQRTELDLYNVQLDMYDKQERTVTAKNMPVINVFAQGGYGRPGLNMMSNKFSFFAMGGVKLTWNFGNLYTRKNDLRLIKNSKDNILVQQEIFLFNANQQLTKEQAEIDKLHTLIERDSDIIRLRIRIREAGESKYKNGVYQINELIRDINNESSAKQTKAFREIQHLQSIYNYKYLKGN